MEIETKTDYWDVFQLVYLSNPLFFFILKNVIKNIFCFLLIDGTFFYFVIIVVHYFIKWLILVFSYPS